MIRVRAAFDRVLLGKPRASGDDPAMAELADHLRE